MKNIEVYDIEYETLMSLEEKHDTTVPDIIEALLEAVEAGDIRIEDYL